MSSDEELTPEEASAWQAMQAEETPEATESAAPAEAEGADGQASDEAADEAQAADPAEGESEPEFKSQREKPPEGFVPHGAFHAEREARKALETKIAELERRVNGDGQEQEPPQWADPVLDPEGHKRWIEHQNEPVRRMVQQQEQQAQIAQQANLANQLEAQFAEQVPEYPDAAKWLHEQRVGELRQAGYNDAEIAQQVRQDVMGLFQAGVQSGVNPAELLYTRAVRAGFKPQPAQRQPDKVQAEASKMAAQSRAQEQTRGLGQGGEAPATKYTADVLASMSERELAKVPDEEIAKAFGG